MVSFLRINDKSLGVASAASRGATVSNQALHSFLNGIYKSAFVALSDLATHVDLMISRQPVAVLVRRMHHVTAIAGEMPDLCVSKHPHFCNREFRREMFRLRGIHDEPIDDAPDYIDARTELVRGILGATPSVSVRVPPQLESGVVWLPATLSINED